MTQRQRALMRQTIDTALAQQARMSEALAESKIRNGATCTCPLQREALLGMAVAAMGVASGASSVVGVLGQSPDQEEINALHERWSGLVVDLLYHLGTPPNADAPPLDQWRPGTTIP